MNAAVTAAVAAQAAVVQAIKASGVVVQVAPTDFLALIARQPQPLVVQSSGGLFSTTYTYVFSYKGLAFACESDAPLALPADAECVEAAKIWLPG